MSLRLFVYGTLKRGFAQHAAYCARTRAVEAGRTRGRLYVHDDGYPALVVASDHVLAVATGDRACDAHAVRRNAADLEHVRALLLDDASLAGEGATATSDPSCSADADGRRDGDRADGELLTFARDAVSLAALDEYEGFEPGGASLFVRVMVRVEPRGAPRAVRAWTYAAGAAMDPLRIRRCPTPYWPPDVQR